MSALCNGQQQPRGTVSTLVAKGERSLVIAAALLTSWLATGDGCSSLAQ